MRVRLLAAGLGGGFGPDAPLASLTLGGLLGLSGLHRSVGRLLGGAVGGGRLDLGGGGCGHHLLLEELLLDRLRRRRNHLHLGRRGRRRLGQSHRLSLELRGGGGDNKQNIRENPQTGSNTPRRLKDEGHIVDVYECLVAMFSC